MADDCKDFSSLLAAALRAREAYERARKLLLDNPSDTDARDLALEVDDRLREMQCQAAKAYRSAASMPDGALSPRESVHKSVQIEDTIELCEALQVPLRIILDELGIKAE